MKRLVQAPLISFILLALLSTSKAQSYPPGWSSASSYAVGDQVQLNGNVLRAVRAVTPGSFKYAYWELWDVRANTTILVGTGGQFPTLPAAWNYALNCRIAQGAYLHLVFVQNHSETISGPFNLDHADGANISILGQNASNTTLSFTNSADGFDLDSGHALAEIAGVTLQPSGGSGGRAIHAIDNSVISDVENVGITGFAYGVSAGTHGLINLGANVNISIFDYAAYAEDGGGLQFNQPISIDGTGAGNGSTAFWAERGGTINCASMATATSCAIGFLAERSASIWAANSDVNGGSVGTYGYHAVYGSTIEADFATANNCSSVGFYAQLGSKVYAYTAGTNACNVGYQSDSGSYIRATHATSAGNNVNVLTNGDGANVTSDVETSG